ncbi:unnamed protein product [Penicillium camemberti]|uniref:Str. FM013 n=1 Tax=Penicillium camemberti (strain FM 013) TaxID=1429867 RepID=A0A0G4NVX0_PENC3|nr:unnamed protein product [Penicillium camemberti]
MSQSQWQQVRTYVDHLGHRVVLEQYVTPDYEPEPEHVISIQVYSLVPLDDDHTNLRYLMQSFWDNEVKPLFEIYSYYPPGDFACIKPNCIEIARRKQQHRSGVENLLPLIPQFIPIDWAILKGRFCELFRLFTVILDRAKFVSEAGVYFYMAYLDGSENPDPSMQDAPDDTQVVRGVDMSTVAARLGVVVLDGVMIIKLRVQIWNTMNKENETKCVQT